MTARMVQVVFVVPTGVDKRLMAIAKKLKVSKSWVARRALLSGLEKPDELLDVVDAVKWGRQREAR